MAKRTGRALEALTALNARVYAPFPSFAIDWDGRPIPKGFGPAVQRLRRAGPEGRALDPAAAVEAFLYHYRLGIHYGYPECCVLQYAMEVAYVSPLLLRGGIVLGQHVPCDACLEAYLLDYITDGPALREYPAPMAAVLV
ncbi:MAG: hypothetical protein LC620_00130 [Halobacteriales archaeon]|nr:hypothetical protein [Halobacteriales archaeon]